MGLMSLFGKGPLSEGKIAKMSKLAANPFAQPDVRMREMSRLLNDGSPAALRGVLKRFASNASGAIADEDEKKWLEDTLVEHGEDTLEPLADYIRTEEQLTYALRAYRRIAGTDATIAFFLSVLQKYGPDDYRSSDSKVQIILELGQDLADPRVLPALVPFLHDHGDDVRWSVMDLVERAAREGILDGGTQKAVAHELGVIVTTDDNRPRIERRAAEVLADHEWPVDGTAETLPPLLADDFFIDKKRFVRRRRKKADGA